MALNIEMGSLAVSDVAQYAAESALASLEVPNDATLIPHNIRHAHVITYMHPIRQQLCWDRYISKMSRQGNTATLKRASCQCFGACGCTSKIAFPICICCLPTSQPPTPLPSRLNKEAALTSAMSVLQAKIASMAGPALAALGSASGASSTDLSTAVAAADLSFSAPHTDTGKHGRYASSSQYC